MISGRDLRNLSKRVMRDIFEFGQRLGIDILPRHFYSSVPDIRELRRTEEWRQPHSMYGIGGATPEEQLAFLDACCAGAPENLSATTIYERACEANGAVGYGPIEAGFLHRFITSKRPRRVVQVGAGVSTSVMLAAAESASHNLQLTCIDPYPTDFLRAAARSGRISLIEDRAQTVALESMLNLSAGDLFFVDSTHTVKPGSEVNRIILEVLPRLPTGTYVHFHDIYFPFDYAPNLMSEDLFFWNETPLLYSFLVGNSSARLRLSLSMMHSSQPDELRRRFPDYRPHPADVIRNATLRSQDPSHYPSSVYLEIVG